VFFLVGLVFRIKVCEELLSFGRVLVAVEFAKKCEKQVGNIGLRKLIAPATLLE
jgi:hypothetical protein